jgi:gamma-glutamyltranspeptidase/glutathione hydrolase/leukotriene-C4 hydrolase
VQDGQVKAVLGGSGGIKILTTVAQVLLKIFAGVDPFSAVSLPRLHHNYFPNILDYENFTAVRGELELESQSTLEFLSSRGHTLVSTSGGAVSQLVLHDFDKGKLIGVSDLRKDGYPAGY